MVTKHWEYYCYTCGQLRLHVCKRGNDDKPGKCLGCGGKNLEVDEVGSKELEKLRYGNNQPPPSDTDIQYY